MSGAFRLLDDFQARYIKLNGREPRTLEQLALARAEYENACRLAEIKAMREKLALLDELAPAIAAAGVNLGRRTIGRQADGRTLRIHAPFIHDNELHAALLKVGFVEVERSQLGSYDTVTMRHGRALRVKIDVTRGAA